MYAHLGKAKQRKARPEMFFDILTDGMNRRGDT